MTTKLYFRRQFCTATITANCMLSPVWAPAFIRVDGLFKSGNSTQILAMTKEEAEDLIKQLQQAVSEVPE